MNPDFIEFKNYSFNDHAIGTVPSTGSSVIDRLITRPPGLSNTAWYCFAGDVCLLLNEAANSGTNRPAEPGCKFLDSSTGLPTNVYPGPVVDIAPRVITVTDLAEDPRTAGRADIYYHAELDDLDQYAEGIKSNNHYARGPTLASAIGSLVIINQKELGFQIVVGDGL